MYKESIILERKKWIVLNYNLPTEPSRPRVAAWRKLKKLGAINIQQSMWIMIYDEENHKQLNEISKDVESNGGTSFLMECTFYEDSQENRVIALFNEMRDEEYNEYINECKKYIKEINKEISIEKYTFAELEEEEAELNKLVSWHRDIRSRDVFNSSQREEAFSILGDINEMFEGYSEMVYKYSIK
jgi:DNA-binding transcriptional regulator PaaX